MPVFSCRFPVCGRLYKLTFVGTLRDGTSFSSLTIFTFAFKFLAKCFHNCWQVSSVKTNCFKCTLFYIVYFKKEAWILTSICFKMQKENKNASSLHICDHYPYCLLANDHSKIFHFYIKLRKKIAESERLFSL